MHQNTFIFYQISPSHLLKAPSKGVKTHKVNPLWKSDADRLLAKVPRGSQLLEGLKHSGIRSPQDSATAICVLQGYPQDRSQQAMTASSARVTDSFEHCLLAAGQYSASISNWRAEAAKGIHLVAFQKLVFVSLCVILLHQGCQIGFVDSLMRNTFGNTSDKNLKRLRSGALWANKLINSLSKKGWGKRASDLVFLC